MKDNKSSMARAEAYERPSLTILGTAHELTLGPNGGPNKDVTFDHHTSP